MFFISLVLGNNRLGIVKIRTQVIELLTKEVMSVNKMDIMLNVLLPFVKKAKAPKSYTFYR